MEIFYIHGFLYCIPWLFFIIFLPIGNFYFNSSSFAYVFLAIGALLFEIGCLIGNRKGKKNARLEKKEYYLKINFTSLKIITLIEIVFTLYVLYKYYRLIVSNYTYNILQTYFLNKTELSNYGIIAYGRSMFLALGICVIAKYYYICEEDKKKYLKYMKVQLILLVILTITRMNRNGMLFMLLSVLFSYIVAKRQRNKVVLKEIIIAFVIFIVFFSVFSSYKYFYQYEKGNFLEKTIEQITGYGCGGIIAFQRSLDLSALNHYYGLNTFRFFIAIYDDIAKTHLANNLVQSFITIGPNAVTNVYTIYKYYADDFGLGYALIVQFLIGIIHGVSYKKMSESNTYGIYVYSILIYPLIMQFFEDQYFSLASTWVQMILFGFIILKTNLIFSTYNPDEKNKKLGANTK